MSNFNPQQRYLTRSFVPNQNIRTPEPGTNPFYRQNANTNYITRPNEINSQYSTVYKQQPSNVNYVSMNRGYGGRKYKKSRKSRKSRKSGKSRKSRK
uniref:Uncharacterized protein n=1 Tax=viral metagenome TaxID=1070528 RepID=A0A6C0JHB3_9ZZZZ